MTPYLVTLTVSGAPPSMKNQRRILRNNRTGKPFSAKSVDALHYEQSFSIQVPHEKRIGYEGPVSVRARIWYPSRRQDLDMEYLCDLLQRCNVLKNDRQIHHKECWKGLSKEHPRVHLTIAKWEVEDASNV
jgi:Holliday junction resolvase RusA-like endonuclease